MINPYQKSKIVIVGAGLMGCGIAQVFSSHNITTVICDPLESARLTALDRIKSNLKIQQLDDSLLAYVRIAENLPEELADADYVIEAAPEKLQLKQSIFSELVKHSPSHCVLASNTSVIPIRDIARGLPHADRIIGTHWWNPPFLVPLVEVVQSDCSSSACVESMMALLTYVGKKPIHVKKDVTGFVANRLQHALWREAIAMVNDGVCDAQTIDVAVKNSFGLRLPVLGPMENADLVGLDLTQDIHNVILADLNTDREPSDILKEKVKSGELGVKTGRGFREWSEEQVTSLRNNLMEYLVKVNACPIQHSDNLLGKNNG